MPHERLASKNTYVSEHKGWDAWGTPIENTPDWDPEVRVFECPKKPGHNVLYKIDSRMGIRIISLQIKCPHCQEIHERVNPIGADTITSFLEEKKKKEQGRTGK